MSISKDLFLAILSMDAYNRGYGAGVTIAGDSIGLASIINRTAVGVGAPEYQDWQDAGFYAVAYEMDADVGEGADRLLAGQISYRGTNAAA